MLNNRAQICCIKAKAHILSFEESGNTYNLEFAFLYLIKASQLQNAQDSKTEDSSDDPAGTNPERH